MRLSDRWHRTVASLQASAAAIIRYAGHVAQGLLPLGTIVVD
jgi:hypothetical protein